MYLTLKTRKVRFCINVFSALGLVLSLMFGQGALANPPYLGPAQADPANLLNECRSVLATPKIINRNLVAMDLLDQLGHLAGLQATLSFPSRQIMPVDDIVFADIDLLKTVRMGIAARGADEGPLTNDELNFIRRGQHLIHRYNQVVEGLTSSTAGETEYYNALWPVVIALGRYHDEVLVFGQVHRSSLYAKLVQSRTALRAEATRNNETGLNDRPNILSDDRFIENLRHRFGNSFTSIMLSMDRVQLAKQRGRTQAPTISIKPLPMDLRLELARPPVGHTDTSGAAMSLKQLALVEEGQRVLDDFNQQAQLSLDKEANGFQAFDDILPHLLRLAQWHDRVLTVTGAPATLPRWTPRVESYL
ncbi:MAG: hypothetical protein H6626_06975 [Pseudobdellovibrionaceae bacterium]|nr:hypothetical protein [Bdellovibrionales bacterium]USN48825.1 MAG: hypothetical protein H6626_06975 [Pseudobdellovibrionaceae bacterium]